MSRARELSRLGNPNIISADSEYNVGFGTLTPRAKGDFVGVVSATSFYGDGSTLSNIASAGIGTALSDEKTSPLNSLFYTNQTVRVGTSTEFNPPTSGSLGYSQAAEVEVADGADFTVGDGDVFMVDVLGITTDPLAGASVDNNYLFSTVYADNITNQAGTGAPDASQGFKISKTTESTNSITGALIVSGGVGIAKSLHVGGNVSVGGTLTYEDVTNVDVVGLATYRSGAKFGVAGVGGTITGTGNATFAGIVTASMPASNITSGIVTSARLGGGSASASTYLQGDGQWGSISSGLSEVDYWQTTNSWNASSAGDNILTGAGGAGGVLARVGVSSGFGDAQGTGMSHSSGVWTFPSTGYWEVDITAALTWGSGNNKALQAYTANNSSYTNYYGFLRSAYVGGVDFTRVYKISDTSNQKIKLGWHQTGTNTDVVNIYFTFKKLA
jgi:hypothetical protein